MSLIVWAATLLHIVVGILLLSDSAASGSTGPAEVVSILGRTGAGIAMLLASVLALISIYLVHGTSGTLLLIPQQLLLYIGAYGGLDAMLDGQYADGVMRPHVFILTDQLPLLIFAGIHTLAVIDFPWRT